LCPSVDGTVVVRGTNLLDDRAHTRAPPEGLGRRFRLSCYSIVGAAYSGRRTGGFPFVSSKTVRSPTPAAKPVHETSGGPTPDARSSADALTEAVASSSPWTQLAASDAGWTVVSPDRDTCGLADRQVDITNHMGGETTRRPTMTAAEASAVLNVSRNTVYSWARQGRIRAYREGWQWRYLRSEIVALARADQGVPSQRSRGQRPAPSPSDDIPLDSFPEQL
jgi:excisionase family DNA binding protein